MTRRKRIRREQKTVQAMIELYCFQHHGTKKNICSVCKKLLDYSIERTDNCLKREQKSTCGKCNTPCYSPEKQKQIRIIMRYAGPRMIFRHPVMAIQHLIDGLGK